MKETSVLNRIRELLPSEAELEKLFDALWPICRSLTGNGFRESLSILGSWLPVEKIEVPTGTPVFDWVVPKEWNIEDAWIEDEAGVKVVDFRENNLHVLNYSTPVDRWMLLEELQNHLHSLPDQPDAIPYLTSYYQERWGFCLRHSNRIQLKPGKYRAVVRSSLEPGSLTYGTCVLPSTEGGTEEVLLSTYLCHPSLANNELSGPLVMASVYRVLSSIPRRNLNYRFVVVPETIGSITFLKEYGEKLKASLRGGLVVTCCGDRGNFTYKKSRRGNSEIDRLAQNVLFSSGRPFEMVDFFPSGSDERQYCSPGFDLPVGSLMRTMYGKYPEYHTSLDNKDFISFNAMKESAELYLRLVLSMEANETFLSTVRNCEPMLGKRGLYPSLGSQKDKDRLVNQMMWLLNFADGSRDLCDIADRAGFSVLDMTHAVEMLQEHSLLVKAESRAI